MQVNERGSGRTYRTVLHALLAASQGAPEVTVIAGSRHSADAIAAQIRLHAPYGTKSDQRNRVQLPNGAVITVRDIGENIRGRSLGMVFEDHYATERKREAA